MEGKEKNRNQGIFARPVRAGRRTYFFDVKQTRSGDLFLTITESKKIFKKKDSFRYEKHKIFLYKEDFDKFAKAFEDAVDFVREHVDESLEKGGLDMQEDQNTEKSKETPDTAESNNPEENDVKEPDQETEKFTNVSFDDLDPDAEKGEEEK
ncbi:MAG: DUF3276 family protein [Bacteroidota bacterium]